MSREIRRRSKLSGLASSDLIQEYLATVSALEVLPVTDVMHGTLVYIQDLKALFAYHSDATDTANGTTVIQPAANVGRWFRISAAGPTNTQVYGDIWVDPTHADHATEIVVDDEWECR